MSELPSEADVVIVGGGPAGLSAAAELKALGVRSVVVLERDVVLGGVPRHCGHSPYGLREFRRPMLGPAYARALAARAARGGAEIHTSVMVSALHPGPVVAVTSEAGESRIAARAVLLATGIRETPRATRFIGGTKPGGVMVTGALQGLIYGAGMRPFRQPVILGTELVAFSAILTCRHAGIRPRAMVEPDSRVTAWGLSGGLPRLLGIPLRLVTDIAAIEGRDRVDAVVLATPKGHERLAADGVVVTGKFRPEAALARGGGLVVDPGTGGPSVDECGRCTEPGYYAAGNLLRPVETAGWCWDEGRAVARAIARDLGGPAAPIGLPVALSGLALKYAVPQRLSGQGDPVFRRMHLRVREAVRGHLGLRINGHEIAGRSISALPERRLFLPLPRPPRSGRVDVVLETR
jgi:thioredoxin reductase